MLRGKLLHPEILESLASAGHGAVILIADGNYPFSMQSNPSARRVYLNLAPGLLQVTDVLAVIADVVPIESAAIIAPDENTDPPIRPEFEALLPGVPMSRLTRFPFYAAACSHETVLVIATGEQRTYACILLTIGVITGETSA